ncbi:MAG: RIO1 family regulatory kinase/ATPase [Caldilineaceae bacterium]
MTTDLYYTDEYDEYIDRFHLLGEEEKARPRKLRSNRKPKKSDSQIIAALADETAGLEGGWKISYTPARFETQWLLSSLQPFYDQGLISDVLSQVKGGKEANVYLCKAEPGTGLDLIAAKVYRPRQFRNLSNDRLYREGRELMTDDASINRRKDSRVTRAIKKKTEFGAEILHSSWLMHEYGTLGRLHSLGAAVPKAISCGENAILMSYVGDERRAAPTLSETGLEGRLLQPLFHEAMRNVELMIQNGMIHGDLSAYNILYWQEQITLIDFPQVTNAIKNGSAYFILKRDVQRVCEYFARQGFARDPLAITEKLWWKYVGLDPVRKLEEDL